jgi:hypothetical protein
MPLPSETLPSGTDVAPLQNMHRSPHPPLSPDQSASRIHVRQSLTSVASPVAGALLGAGVGTVLGVLAGPPGMWTGALLGALAGAAAGRAMDVQGSRTSKHEAELDDQIGVTSRSLGRPLPRDLPLAQVQGARALANSEASPLSNRNERGNE